MINRDFHIDDFRQKFESDKQWLARKRFIIKHIANYDTSNRDQLLALSLVWVNHVFMGCRWVCQTLRYTLHVFAMDTASTWIRIKSRGVVVIKHFAMISVDTTSSPMLMSNRQTVVSIFSVEVITLYDFTKVLQFI